MSTFALVSVEHDYKVDISQGKVTVGRGPILKVTDKRVSRNHAILEVSDTSFTVVPIHHNPTFYQESGGTKFEPLEKDQVKKLQDGDCVSFLPNDLVFRVEIKNITDTLAAASEVKEDSEKIAKHTNVENKESKMLELKLDEENNEKLVSDVSGEEDKILNKISDEPDDHSDSDDSDSDFEEEDNKTETEKPAQILTKTRVLPDWMTKNKGKETMKTPKKGVTKSVKKVHENGGNGKEDVLVNETKTKASLQGNERGVNDKHKEDERKNHEIQEEIEKQISVKTEDDMEEDGGDEIDKQNGKDTKRKRDEETESSSEREKKQPRCQYGANCYRKNPAHFQEYSHDQSDDEESRGDLPKCPYGEYCYRKNPRHRKLYKHSPQPKTPDRRAKRKAATSKIRGDDEDGPNDYDYDDSFIDDESESSDEPSDNEDSDWQPPDDEAEDDDVSELLTEARNFTDNEKMLKPT